MAKRNGKPLPAPSLIAVEPGKRYQVRCDGPFLVVAVESDKRFVIGPNSETARWFAFTAWSSQVAVLPKQSDAQYTVSFAVPADDEDPDPVPLEIPVHGRVRSSSMAQVIADEVRRQMELAGGDRVESLEDADDFDTEDEDAPSSGYEDDALEDFDAPPRAEPETPKKPPEEPAERPRSEEQPKAKEKQPGDVTPHQTGTAAP